MFKVIKIVLFIVVFVPIENNAQTSVASYLYWQPSAKYYAMGGIGTSLQNDIFSAYYNPAGLVFSKRITFTGSFVKPYPFFGDIANSFLGISYRIDGSNAISISGNLYWMGKQVRTLEGGPEPVSIQDSPFHWHTKLSYSRLIFENFSFGFSLGILVSDLSDVQVGEEQNKGTATTVLLDAGLLLRDLFSELTQTSDGDKINFAPFFDWLIDNGEEYQNKGIAIGIAISNIGPDLSYVDAEQSDPPPSKLSIGISYIPVSLNTFGVLIGGDIEKRLNESNSLDYVHLGGELKLFNAANFRIGYFWNTVNGGFSYPTYGGGISLKYISLNVASYNRSLQSTWHFDLTTTLEF